MKSLGDRIKSNYEAPCRHLLARRTPLIIRLDGRAFHTLTRSAERPFDAKLHSSMIEVAQALMAEVQGCKVAYTQSDEVSLLVTDYDTLQTEPWMGYVKSKVESISASLASSVFEWQGKRAMFDSRAFSVPREEVTNYFLWRLMDWTRNSLFMLARAHFSHKQLHKKGQADLHEMLHEKGINWVDLAPWKKNGTWLGASPAGHQWADLDEALRPLTNCDLP